MLRQKLGHSRLLKKDDINIYFMIFLAPLPPQKGLYTCIEMDSAIISPPLCCGHHKLFSPPQTELMMSVTMKMTRTKHCPSLLSKSHLTLCFNHSTYPSSSTLQPLHSMVMWGDASHPSTSMND